MHNNRITYAMLGPLFSYISGKNKTHKSRSPVLFLNIILLFITLSLTLSPCFLIAKPVRPGPQNLIDDLLSADKSRRNIALRHITANKPPDLLPRLADTIRKTADTDKRNFLIDVMKLYGARDAVPYWIRILEKSKSHSLKEQVIKNIADFNDRRAVMAIAQELKNPHITVRQEAARALRRADDRIYPLVLDMAASKNPVYRLYAIEAFYYIYDRRFYDTIEDFLSDENKSVRIYALRCICENKLNKAIKKIRYLALNDSNDEVRTEAVRSLGIFRDSESLGILYSTLRDKNNNIRYASILAIESIKYRNSAYKLSTQLYNEDNDENKKAIIDTLITLKHTGNISGLQKILLRDANTDLRIHAAYALGYIRNFTSLPVVLESLKDKDYRVRAEACAALGSFKNKITISDLIKIVNNDSHRYTRSAALYAIKKINDRKSVLPLYDIYAVEKDPVFKEQLRSVIRIFIDKYI